MVVEKCVDLVKLRWEVVPLVEVLSKGTGVFRGRLSPAVEVAGAYSWK